MPSIPEEKGICWGWIQNTHFREELHYTQLKGLHSVQGAIWPEKIA